MSGPVRPPLTVTDGTTTVRPTNGITFDAADGFTVTKNGNDARIDFTGGGGTIGGTIADTQVAFGTAADTIGGSANFTFVDEAGGNGPYVTLKGDKPYISIEDDTDANNYKTNYMQSGASMYLTSQTNDATEYQILRAVGGSTGDFIINPQMRNKDTYVSGDNQQYLLFVDAGEDRVGIGTNAPEQTLDVSGDMQLNRNGATGSLTRKLYIEGARFDAGSDFAQVVFSNYDGAEYQGAVIAARNDPDGVKDGTLVFRTANNDTLEDMMSITNNLIHINDLNNNFDFRVDGEYTDNLLRVDGSRSSVGILTQPDTDVSLHIKDNNSQDVLVRLETDENSADKSPALEFYKNSAADISDYIMAIDSYGLDDASNKSHYSRIATYIEDETALTENAVMIFQVVEAGSMRNNLILGSTLITVNQSERNVDFKILSDDGSINFYSDAGINAVGMQGQPTTGLADNNPALQVNGSISGKMPIIISNSDVTLTRAGLSGQTYVITDGGTTALTMPLGALQGDYFYFVASSGSTQIVVDVGTQTLNGGTSALTRGTNNEVYTVICVEDNKFILSNPA